MKRLNDYDFKAQPSVDSRLIDELSTGRYREEGRNIIFLGPSGVGKTHLAIGRLRYENCAHLKSGSSHVD